MKKFLFPVTLAILWAAPSFAKDVCYPPMLDISDNHTKIIYVEGPAEKTPVNASASKLSESCVDSIQELLVLKDLLVTIEVRLIKTKAESADIVNRILQLNEPKIVATIKLLDDGRVSIVIRRN
jgi:hypothetical protein